jgi:hypothetical protein
MARSSLPFRCLQGLPHVESCRRAGIGQLRRAASQACRERPFDLCVAPLGQPRDRPRDRLRRSGGAVAAVAERPRGRGPARARMASSVKRANRRDPARTWRAGRGLLQDTHILSRHGSSPHGVCRNAAGPFIWWSCAGGGRCSPEQPGCVTRARRRQRTPLHVWSACCPGGRCRRGQH